MTGRILSASIFIACFFTSPYVGAQKSIAKLHSEIDSLSIEITKEAENDKKASMLVRLAILYKNTGQYQKGITAAEQSILISKQTGNKTREAAGFNMIGVLNKDLGNLGEAITNYQKVLNLLDRIKDKGALAGTYNNIANIYSYWGKLDEGVQNYFSALKLYEEAGNKQGMAICYNNIGQTYIEQAKYGEALNILLKAFDIFKETNFKSGMAAAYSNIGGIHHKWANYPEALKYHLLSLKYYTEGGDQAGSSSAYIAIGDIYLDQMNYTEALKQYSEALATEQKIQNKKGVATLLNKIGILKQKQGKLDEAIQFHRDALDYNREAEMKPGINANLIQLGKIYVEKARFSEALATLLEAEKISKEIKDTSALAEIYNSIGLIQLQGSKTLNGTAARKKLSESLDYLQAGLLYAKRVQSKQLTRELLASLALFYYEKKDYRNAVIYERLHTAVKDSLFSNETTKKLENLRIQYEIEKAQSEEMARQEQQKAIMQTAFDRREDSIRYQQNLLAAQLSQQTLISREQEQALRLKQTSLDLINKQNELNRLNFLKSQAELENEQIKRQEKEQELTISNQQKSLQSTQLSLQKTELNLKESQLRAQRRQRTFFLGGVILLFIVFGLLYRIERNRQKSDRLVSVEKLKSEKAQAAHKMVELELQSLRAQLNPHFMFNSLNAIQELILREDNDKSHLYLSRFSELLRMLLDNANQPFVSLKKEINLLELYLSLEKLRITDLKYSITISDGIDVNRVMIPNMMLQPYIENAIWHGLSNKVGDRNLEINIRKRDNLVICEVIDNGVGRKKAAELKSLYRKEHRSKGMELLSRRFNLLSKEYGSEIKTAIRDLQLNGTPAGTSVEIAVPFSLSEKTNLEYI